VNARLFFFFFFFFFFVKASIRCFFDWFLASGKSSNLLLFGVSHIFFHTKHNRQQKEKTNTTNAKGARARESLSKRFSRPKTNDDVDAQSLSRG
jgi:hypothetical protein